MALYAFDGTWQAEEADGEFENSNVVRFKDAYDGKAEYYRGIGTRGGKVRRWLAGATGLGGELRVEDAKDDLDVQLQTDDRIVDVVGFSRGAALALDFVNEIEKTLRDAQARVRFLGLFDTVHSFGIAGIDVNLLHDPDVPDIVDHCFHALALDERRGTFTPTRTPNHHEVWFRGVHSDIGGGNDNPGLNDITLRWMLSKAIAVGLPIKPGVIASLDVDPEAPIKPAPFDPLKDPFRQVLKGDRIHYTVKARAGHNKPEASAPRESEADESGLVA